MNIRLFSLALAATLGMAAWAQNDAGRQCGLVGFANVRDMGLSGTTGGGQTVPVRVQTREQLAQYAKGSTPCVIIVENNLEGAGKNDTKDYISLGSNKTIVGAGQGVTLDGLGFDANGQQNIIIRNLKLTKCKPDALAFRNTHHVWIDHCDLSDSDDGLLDFTIGSSYLTVSWTKFHDHDKVSICNSGTEHFEDYGRERATYHHCAFVGTTQRNPRFGYGLGHVFNNYYTQNSSYCVGYHTRAKAVVENSYFTNTKTPLQQMYAEYSLDAHYADCLSRGNIFNSCSGNTKDTGTGFDIARYYGYEGAMADASAVETLSSYMGLGSDIEHDIIPFPGDYAIDIDNSCKLQAGAISGATEYKYVLGKTSDNESQYLAYNAGTTVLEPGTSYVWYATVATPGATYRSNLFHFTTASLKATKPLPEDGDAHAALREALTEKGPCSPMMLRWREGFDAVSYKVYMREGTAVDDADFIGETATAAIAPGSLKYGAQYAWRVDAVKADGTVTRGDTWTFSSDKTDAGFGRTEMETSVRNGIAFVEQQAAYRTYSGGASVCGEAGPGSMSVVWKEADANCDITTTFFDWQKKNGTYKLYVNEELRDSWIAQVDGQNMFTHVSKAISIRQGDELRIEFATDGKMRMRTDCIDIEKSGSAGIDDVDATENTRELRIYTIDGRYAGNRVEGLGSGIYIVNGKKIAL